MNLKGKGASIVNFASKAGRDGGGAGSAEEVADLVAYLAGDESSFITGNNVDINGGLAFS